jgi:hypothetical protein
MKRARLPASATVPPRWGRAPLQGKGGALGARPYDKALILYSETREICANLSVHFPGDSGIGFQEKSLARNRKTNIVHAPSRLAEMRVMLPERLF